MDKQAFKQRMQNLKSYRENNPGKGYWDWKVEAFAEGGQTGDPEKERFYQATGRSSSGRPLEEGLKPVFSLEDAANMTPIGDAISAKDTYDAVKKQKRYLNKFRDNSLLYSTDIMGIDYEFTDIEDAIYDSSYNIELNKVPVYSPELTDKELMALLSHRKGEYFTDVEMYRYMNSLIIRLCKEEIYGNDDNATVSNTKL